MNAKLDIVSVIGLISLVAFFALPAYAVNCDRTVIYLGQSLQEVQQVCREPLELLHVFKRTRVVYESRAAGIHARRRDSYLDDLVYVDKQHHEKITFRFKDEILTDIFQEFMPG